MKLARLKNGTPEIFLTIQGEGASIGVLSIFIRASVCNLHCTFCDTPYTWNFEGSKFKHNLDKKYNKNDEQIEMSTSEIISEVKKFNCKHIVFTGGEPMIYQKEIIEIMNILTLQGYSFEIETAGTLMPSQGLLDLMKHKALNRFNCSPKLENSGNQLSLRYKPEVLKTIASSNSIFKFVTDGSDLNEIMQIVSEIAIDKKTVYLMPIGTTAEEVMKYSHSLIDDAKKHGVNFTTRLHVLLWGAIRCV